jgi:SWI/SNF-related matrix-associated actin-dependent regulator 1 of chromatin subfamily A
MRLTQTDNRIEAISEYSEKDALKQAGFRWDSASRRWWTGQATRAARLLHVAEMDESLRHHLEGAGDAEAQALRASRATDAEIAIPCPKGLEYMPFQRAGIAYAMARPATLIADEMGLGKTIQAIGLVNGNEKIKNIVVICPASLKLNWLREMERWLTRSMTVAIAPEDADVVITNYEQLHKLPVRPVDLLIVDEAHMLKNPKTKRTKAVRAWAKAANRRLFLTGTPILNRPIELHSIVDMLDPGNWPFWAYAKRYCAAFEGRFGWDMSGASNLAELQERLRSTIMVRRLKRDVLTELPPKRRQIIEVEVGMAASAVGAEAEAERQWAEARAEASLMAEVAEELGDKAAYEAAVRRLSDIDQVIFEEMSGLRHDTALAKAPAVADHVELLLASVPKVVVMAHHHDVIDLIKDRLAAYGVVSLTGRDDQGTRQDAVDRFQADPEVRVFVGSIQAAGVGITLTAASVVIFGELDWVPGNMSQAEDRLHRIGQTESVLVQHLVIDDSMDSRLAKTLVAKQTVLDAAMDDEVAREPIKALPVRPAVEPLPPGQAELVLTGLRVLADQDPDRAGAQNGVGYSRMDTALGHSLAGAETLTIRQARLGKMILKKYHKQLPPEVMAIW